MNDDLVFKLNAFDTGRSVCSITQINQVLKRKLMMQIKADTSWLVKTDYSAKSTKI